MASLNYVREDGSTEYTADDRVRWSLTPRQREICQAVLALATGNAHPSEKGVPLPGTPEMRAAWLRSVKAHVYRRMRCVLSAATATGNRYYETTDTERDEMTALGISPVGDVGLYHNDGSSFGDYVDAVMSVTGATEAEVWEAVGLRPYTGHSHDHARTRKEAAQMRLRRKRPTKQQIEEYSDSDCT